MAKRKFKLGDYVEQKYYSGYKGTVIAYPKIYYGPGYYLVEHEDEGRYKNQFGIQNISFLDEHITSAFLPHPYNSNTLKSKGGCFIMHSSQLQHAALPYDPIQNGDTDEDI